MYKIKIESLTFDTIIGILDYEKVTPQRVVVDFECEYEMSSTFIDYADIAEFIKSSMIDKKYELIESALDDILSNLAITYPNAKNFYLKISKPDILKECIVSVSKSI